MNTFGSTTQQFALCDPRSVREDRLRFRRDAVPSLLRANSLYVPTGRLSARGWLLLPRVEYDQLDKYSTSFALSIGDPRRPDNVGIISGLAIVQAQCVTRGVASDPSALYLIEVTDARGILRNEWFKFPLTTQYNIRSPAYPQLFYTSSMFGGATPWTWTTMLQNMWERMPLLGTWPGLPTVSTGTPEGFWFTGVDALESLCSTLEHIGMTIACDLTASNPYTIVSTGATDSTFASLQSRYTTNLEDDQEWIDVGSGRVPSTVVVLFRRRNSVYGSEETVRRDSLQWSTSSVYSVSIAAPTLFSAAVGTHYIWSDFTVRYDMDGAPLPDDVSTAGAIASERVTQYFDNAYSRTSGYMSQVYAGALPFSTGSQVDGVCWRQDYSDQSRHGWKTRVVRGKYPPFDGVW